MFADILGFFGLSKGPFIAIAILLGIIVLGAGGGYAYYHHETAVVQELNNDIATKAIQITGLQLQEKTYEDDMAKQKIATADIEQKNDTLNKNYDKLAKALKAANLGKAVVKDPTGTQAAVNRDLNDFTRCVAIATGDPVRSTENAVPTDQRNGACPDLFQYKN